MRRPPVSVWLTALLSLYAIAFFAYELGVRHAGFTPRNITVASVAVALIVVVFVVNYRHEHRTRSRKNDNQLTK